MKSEMDLWAEEQMAEPIGSLIRAGRLDYGLILKYIRDRRKIEAARRRLSEELKRKIRASIKGKNG